VLRFVHARPDIYDVSDAYLHREVQQPYVDEPPRAPVPTVKLETEPDPIPDAIGQPPFVPRTRRPIDSQACKYGDPISTESRPKGVSCRPCMLEHYDEHDGAHCEITTIGSRAFLSR
jgi:hypothetical protein